jgi:acyl dehydratase
MPSGVTVFRYQKAGIMLNDFCDKSGQIDLFDEQPPRAGSEQLMKGYRWHKPVRVGESLVCWPRDQ